VVASVRLDKEAARNEWAFRNTKSALSGDLTGTAGKLLGAGALSAGAALGGLGVRAAAKGVGGMFDRSRNNRLFQRLAQKDKNLAKDPRARQYFDLIMTYAPSLGKNDMAIGDFLKKQLQYPVSGHEFLKSLADFESTVSQTGEKRAPARIGLAFESPISQFASGMTDG
jgi:hypothetical protein